MGTSLSTLSISSLACIAYLVVHFNFSCQFTLFRHFIFQESNTFLWVLLWLRSFNFYPSRHRHTKCDQKITVIFKFRELRVFDFRIFFFCYVGRHVCYICWQYQSFWIASLFLTDKKVSRVLVCFSIFLLFEKMDQRNCIKFCVKYEIKCAKIHDLYAYREGLRIGQHLYFTSLNVKRAWLIVIIEYLCTHWS